MRSPLLLAVLLAAPALVGCLTPGAGDPATAHFPVPEGRTTVAGSGATFPKPLLETWGIEYARIQPRIQVSYAGGGSGKGITDITNRDVVFAGSDAPLKRSEKDKAPGLLQIPETLGVVAVAYNVPGAPADLRLDGPTTGRLFTGAIRKWNDPAIAALNPDATLPDADVAVVYRSDSSGTTFVFTDWLSRTSAAWNATMGSGATKKPDWTKSAATQLSGNGNDGVGNLVKSTPNSIAYIELAYVGSLELRAASLKNRAGEFVPPTIDGASAAAAASATSLPAADGDWSSVTIVDAEGPGVYPVSSFTYVLVYGDLAAYAGKATADELNAFRNWLWWSLHEGQEYGPLLGYAELPLEVVRIGEHALEGMTV